MQQHDSANKRVDVSTSTSSAATQDGPVIYNFDSISLEDFSASVGTAAHFGATAAHSERNTRVLLDCYPTTRQARSRLDDASLDNRGRDWRVREDESDCAGTEGFVKSVSRSESGAGVWLRTEARRAPRELRASPSTASASHCFPMLGM